ncbi:Glycosyl hydrolases family 25 [Pseudobutyrivibrio ruminis]|uniref:Glycosyl hydrolases family 25 n=1 Tax=Pseudobutyrivibrio ruminis TaxID=46206 RepID=A0A1H7FYB6_9FIRM|nr:glycoside hydrolase family 25 protein [Pseudobutyrivibrio ruminis]SEK30929.1 Glycosyl hydrolases family 25 [Pseudobutyrivibrio ruminis]
MVMKRALRYILVSTLSIFFTLIAVGIIYIVADTHSRIQVQEGETYSSEQVEELVDEAKAEGQKSVLDSIKESLEEGNTIISVLKSLYPEYIVVAANSKYNFVPVNDSLPKNSFDINNLQEDENGIYSYVVDGQVVSRKGIDVSSHQGDIDWDAVAADGVEFVFVRAVYRGYGTGKIVVDEKCIENIEGAQAAGLDVGVYVFSQAISQAEVLEEASTVLNLLDGYTLQLPIVFDVEKVSDSEARTNSLTVEDRTALTITFLEAVQNAGYDSMIYHNTEMGAMLLDFTQLTDYKKWFAGYNKEFYWPYEFDIWQYSETGSVNGINGNVDLDIWLAQ